MAVTAPDLCVVICESEYLLALDLAQQLERSGCTIAGLFLRYDELLAALQGEGLRCHAAILDTDIHNEAFARVITALTQAGVAIVFHSGYSQAELPSALADIPFFSKPASFERMLESLRDIAGRRGEHHSVR